MHAIQLHGHHNTNYIYVTKTYNIKAHAQFHTGNSLSPPLFSSKDKYFAHVCRGKRRRTADFIQLCLQIRCANEILNFFQVLPGPGKLASGELNTIRRSSLTQILTPSVAPSFQSTKQLENRNLAIARETRGCTQGRFLSLNAKRRLVGDKTEGTEKVLSY